MTKTASALYIKVSKFIALKCCKTSHLFIFYMYKQCYDLFCEISIHMDELAKLGYTKIMIPLETVQSVI